MAIHRKLLQDRTGGTLYGVRLDGAYVARTMDGDRVLSPSERKTA